MLECAVALVAVFGVVLLLAAFIPLVMDLRRGAEWRDDLTGWLKSTKRQCAELLPILRFLARPRGTANTAGRDPRNRSERSAVTVTGGGLSGASIHFGTLPTTPIGPPSDWQVVVAVPTRPDRYPAEVDVVAQTAAGASAITDATSFTFG